MTELITKLQQIKTSVNNIQNELSAAGVIYSPFISAWQGVVTLKEQVISAGADKQELINELSNLQNEYDSTVEQLNVEHALREAIEIQKTDLENLLAERTAQFNDLQIEYVTLSGEYGNLSAMYEDMRDKRDQLLDEMSDAMTIADDILN